MYVPFRAFILVQKEVTMEVENQRGFFGIIITKEILEDNELSVAEKFIYGYIASFTRCCFESNEKIASKLGISESTIKHAIPKLVQKGYLFVEKVNNSNNARRIYSVLDNPKKLAYLARKGLFKPVENSTPVVQNMHNVVQNMHNDKTGVRSAKFAHIDIEENKNKVETEQKQNTPADVAGGGPASRLTIKRSDFDNENEFENEFYKRNTICLGVD